MKKVLVAVSMIVLAATLSGCKEKVESSSVDPSFEKVKSSGVLVIGAAAVFPPMVFVDKDSNVVGFDIDLAKEVCSRLGLRLKIQEIVWANKEEDLYSGRIDCIWNGMSVDSARAKTMNLSDPYLTNRMVFVVKDKSLEHIDMLKEKRLGVQRASTAQTLLDEIEVDDDANEIVLFKDLIPEFDALDSGKVDAVYADEVFVKYWNNLHDKAYTVLDEGSYNEFYAVGFRKQDQSLRDTINSVLNQMKRDGKFVELSVKWFGK